MGGYTNGQFPLSLFTEVPGQEGDNAWLTPATTARWLALKQGVYDTYGVTIWIVPGWNGYRPYENQVIAKNAAIAEGRPLDAADPGTSSHGGIYKQRGSHRDGHQSLAIDVGGYERLNRADWYAMCRKHGFEPGFFNWEPWHIIDWEPQFGWFPKLNQQEAEMYVQWTNDPAKVVYAVSTEVAAPVMRVCGPGEAAIARAGGRVIGCDEGTLLLLSKEAGYQVSLGRSDSGKRLSSAVWNGTVVDRGAAGGKRSVLQDVADTGTIVRRLDQK